jgi:ceramide glucosyltransferase
MAEALCAVLAALACLSLVAAAIAAMSAGSALSEAPADPTAFGELPKVSVLKPLKGLDDGLYENLASFARQDHPDYEILFGAEDPEDPALDVALQVKRDFPSVPISVQVCSGGSGRNPKVRNLAILAARARHEALLISDSNVRVDPGYLSATAAELRDPRVGLVTNLIAGVGGRDESLGSLLENLHLNTFVIGATTMARALAGRACVVGKSMLFRRSDLARLGGWRSLRNLLAEDYLLGRKFEKAGFKVALSPHLVRTVNESWPVSRFLSRHVRWGQLRRRVAPGAFLAELLLNPVLLIVLALAARGSSLRPAEAALGAGGVLFKCVLDARLVGRLRNQPLPLFDIAWIPVKDLLIAAVWPLAAVKRTVCWRGNEMRIGRATRLFQARTPHLDVAGETP